MKKINFISNTNKTRSVFWLIVVVSVFVILLISLLKNVWQANAQVSSFFPTTCLGGWKNVEKATGEPEVTEDLTALYNDSNSASITNAISQIFCGGFKGEIPEDSLQKSIVLKFSWTEVRPEIIEDVADDSTSSPAPELEEIKDDSSLAPTEEPATEPNEPAPSEEELLSPEEITPAPEPEEESAQKEPEIPPEAKPAEPEPVQLLPTETEPVAFNFIFKTAHAQETEESSLDTSSLVPEETEPITDESSVSNARLEVLYTVNGQDWKSLGFLEGTIDNSASFDLPAGIFTTVEDLSQVQIAVHILPTYDNLHTIYLDSMWLEAEYEEVQTDTPPPLANVLGSMGGEGGEEVIKEEGEEEIAGEEILEEEKLTVEEIVEEIPEKIIKEIFIPDPPAVELPPPPPLLSVRKFNKDIALDPRATHHCKAQPFTVNISGADIYITSLVIKKGAEGLYKLEIGSLPAGVDIKFAKNNRYSYEPLAEETSVDLKIMNENGSHKGNFSVMIYFTKIGASNSSTACQINVVNK